MSSDSHMGSQLIGAVHLPNPFSHCTSYMGCVLPHMDHMHGQTGQSGPLSQNPEGMEVLKMAEGGGGSKGGYPGGTGFSFNPYTRTEAPSKLQSSSVWDSQVSIQEQHHVHIAGAPPHGGLHTPPYGGPHAPPHGGPHAPPHGGPHALDDLEVANLNAFLESMDSEARADLMNGQHFQQHFPQQLPQQLLHWPAAANGKFDPCD